MAGQKRLGELLVEMGFIDPRMLLTALEEQKRSHRRLGKILVEMGTITEERLVRALSLQLGIEVCDPIATPVHARVRALLTADIAHRCRVIPIAIRRDEAGQSLFVATADPLDRGVLETLRAHVGPATRIRWMLAGETEIELALARHYGTEPPRAGAHYPPAGQPVFEAPMTSALPPRHMPPVIQGVPVAAGRGGRSPDIKTSPPIAPPGMIADHDGEDGLMEVVPLSDMLPSLDVRGRPPSVVPPSPLAMAMAAAATPGSVAATRRDGLAATGGTASPDRDPMTGPLVPVLPSQIVRGARAESSPPPITRDIQLPGYLSHDPLTPHGTNDSIARFAPEVVSPPVIEHDHVLTPDSEVEDDSEPIDSGEPLNNSEPDLGVLIEEPASFDPEPAPAAIRLRDVAPLNIEEDPRPPAHSPPPHLPPPLASAPPMLGSWGDLFHGGESELMPAMPPPASAPVQAEEPKRNGTPTFDIDVDTEATPFSGTAPLSPINTPLPRSPSQLTLEPDIVAVEDIAYSPSRSAETELLKAAEPVDDFESSTPDDLKWNMALAEAAAEAMAEASVSFDLPPLALEPSIDVELPSEDIETPIVLAPLADFANDQVTYRPVTVPPPAAASKESEADRLRKSLLAFIAGGELDADTSKYAMRVIAALMMSEGMFDDDRLERAIASVKKN